MHPEVIHCPRQVPDDFARAAGLRTRAGRILVSLWWCDGLNVPAWDDGYWNGAGGLNVRLYQTLFGPVSPHPVARWLQDAGAELGHSGMPAAHRVIVSLGTRHVWLAPAVVAQEIVRQQCIEAGSDLAAES